MNLNDLVYRPLAFKPWKGGDNIPWSDPGFSERMLAEHLDQSHDSASRRIEIIERQVDWIHLKILAERTTKVLDLGCGPGLYTHRLTAYGHQCTGIDYSPTSISFARDHAKKAGFTCEYILDDIRQAAYGSEYGLAMFLFGEFNVFTKTDCRKILKKVHRALGKDGIVLIEPYSYDGVRKIGTQRPSWYSSKGGLFSDKPHLCLQENIWKKTTHTATSRFFVVDASSAQTQYYAVHYKAYTEKEYRALLESCGFEDVTFYPSFPVESDTFRDDLIVIRARKR